MQNVIEDPGCIQKWTTAVRFCIFKKKWTSEGVCGPFPPKKTGQCLDRPDSDARSKIADLGPTILQEVDVAR